MRNYITALCMAFAITLPHAAHAQTVTPPAVPPGLEVPEGNHAFLLGHGVGTQNYVCAPTDKVGHVAFTLFTPQATLFSDDQLQLTTHFFSPNPDEGGVVRVTWEDSTDTSIVWAKLITASTDPGFVDPNAVAWLTLQRVGSRVGPTGGNTLAVTTFVQRVNTEGGLAPAEGCEALPDVGKKAFIPYTADYIFYKRN